MNKPTIAAIASVLLALSATTALAAERPSVRPPSGFYGGLVLRDAGVESQGLALGAPTSALSSFGVVPHDDSVSRSLLYGGYRFNNDVAVEASFNSADAYSLRPSSSVRSGGRGLGLVPAAGSLTVADAQARTWNVDVYTSWNFYRSFALYGRLGYAQSDAPPAVMATLAPTTDPRRLRDGINYGLGVRYDMTSSLGLRLEYGRFGRFASDPLTASPQDTDQVTFGLQFRF